MSDCYCNELISGECSVCVDRNYIQKLEAENKRMKEIVRLSIELRTAQRERKLGLNMCRDLTEIEHKWRTAVDKQALQGEAKR